MSEEFHRIEPGLATAYPGSHPAPDNARLPHTARPGAGDRVRWKDLPREEIIRRKVEDTIRYYAGRYERVLTAEQVVNYLGGKMKYVGPLDAGMVSVAMNDPVTVANFREWGVLPDDVETWDEYAAGDGTPQPSRQQMDALDKVFSQLEPTEGRSLPTILAEHGLNLDTWHGWLRDPVFAGYVRDRTAKVFGEQAYRVDVALLRKAASGDVSAIKLVLELQGRLRDDTAVNPDVLLSRVIEILQTEVRDRATLVRVAGRMEALSQAAARGQLTPAPGIGAVIEGEPVTAERMSG